MWPFDNLSPRAKKWIALIAAAAKVYSFALSSNAASGETSKSWDDVEDAEKQYKRNESPRNEDFLKNAYVGFIEQLKKDAEKLPKDSDERKKIEERISVIEQKIEAIESSKIAEFTPSADVVAAVNSTASQMISGSYDFAEPLLITRKKETIQLLSGQELKQLYESVSQIKNLSMKKQALVSRMLSAISQNKEVVKKLQK